MPVRGPHVQTPLCTVQEEIGPEQVHADVVDAIVVHERGREGPPLEERLQLLPFLTGEGLAATGLIEYLDGLALYDRGLFRCKELPQHQEAECVKVGYLTR